MKLSTILMTASLLWGGAVFAGETHFVLEVDGMSCPFCVYGIEKQLKKIEGVEDVSADLARSTFWVQASDPDVLTEESARTLLEDAGFSLRSFTAHEPGNQKHGQNE